MARFPERCTTRIRIRNELAVWTLKLAGQVGNGGVQAMKKALLAAALMTGVSVSGCATSGYGDPYYNRGQTQAGQAATGAAVGALGGAAVGAILPGVSPIGGAIAGGIAGAVLGAVVNGRQYYRDTRGSCYYVDREGRPIYDYNARC
jgi:hypothetical protein